MGCGFDRPRDADYGYFRIATDKRWRIASTASGSWPVILCHSRAKMLMGIVNVRYGRLYRFGRYETHIPSTWLKYRLIWPISARYPAGLSLRVSAMTLVRRLAS